MHLASCRCQQAHGARVKATSSHRAHASRLRVNVTTPRRVRRRTTGQCAAAGEGEDEGVDEGVDAAGEQGEARRRGAPLAGMANSSPVETPSGSPATSCGRV